MSVFTLSVAALLASVSPQQDTSSIVRPDPTGSRHVGVVDRTWIDSMRRDTVGIASGVPSEPRRLLVRIWYPARGTSTTAPPYVPGLDATGGDFGRLYARVVSPSRLNDVFDATAGSAPVIVLAPGRVAAPFEYTSLAEDLASHGYIVAAVASPGHSKIYRPDGTIMPVVFPSMPPSTYPDGFDDAQAPMNALISADLRFSLEQLTVLNRDDPILRAHLDLNRVGMLGHSNGAMAGSRACAAELRCRAFLGVEGPQVRELRVAGNDKPFAQVYSEATLSFDTLGVFTAIRARGSAPFTLYRVTGAGHNSITDLLLVRPALFTYPMAPKRGVEIGRAIARDFFDQYLRASKPAAWNATEFPEVKVERFPAGRKPA